MKKHFLSFIMIMVMLFSGISQAAFAAPDNEAGEAPDRGEDRAVRTIMLYICGADLERTSGLATHNLKQILQSRFSESGQVKLVVMTGGAREWYLEDEFLDMAEDLVPAGEPTDSISTNYNQLWEAKGADATENSSKMVLLDGDGITQDVPVKSENELMTDPTTLKTFINYCVSNYPAEKYDLILWDHGGGPKGGYGIDDHDKSEPAASMMSLSGIIDALSDNDVTNPSGQDEAAKFDFINFDACVMNSVELNLLLSDYTDYYIASAESEPGYGQDYSNWLTDLAGDPYMNTYELGKKIVDDFAAFYNEGQGKGQDGTLAVVDTQKLLNSDFLDALSDLEGIMKDQADKSLFYDEIRSVKSSIQYGGDDYYDIGNLASLISIKNSEIADDDTGSSIIDPSNAYSDANITARICSVLEDPEIIYSRSTNGIRTKNQIYRTSGGDIDAGTLQTSGMYIYFPSPLAASDAPEYYRDIEEAIDLLPDKTDGRYAFLNSYMKTIIDYALIALCGSKIDGMIYYDDYDKNAIDYDAVKNSWKEYSEWTRIIEPMLEIRSGGEEGSRDWLNSLIAQQVAEAVSKKNVSAKAVKEKDGTGYKINIRNTKNRAIIGVVREISASLPYLNKYLEENFNEEERDTFSSNGIVELGSVDGTLDGVELFTGDDGVSIENWIRWYNSDQSFWIIHAEKQKWYAIKDASGKLHVAAFDQNDNSKWVVPGRVGSGKDEQHVSLVFSKETNGLSEIIFESEIGSRHIKPSELKDALSIMPSKTAYHWTGVDYYLPISGSPFTLTAENADEISMVYTDIDNIDDIDGNLHSSYFIKGIYDSFIDITDIVNDTEEELVDIGLARVKPAVFKEGSGKAYPPEVVYLGETLKEGTDYEWDFLFVPDGEDEPTLTEPGEYELALIGKGRFTGITVKTFAIVLPEDAAEQLVNEAQAWVDAAQKAFEENPDSIEAATEVINAQHALTEAQAQLAKTRKYLSAEKQAELQDKIDQLEQDIEDLNDRIADKNKEIADKDKQVSDLNDQLEKAGVVDISNYAVSVSKPTRTYTGKAIKPAVKVSGVNASNYKVTYSNNKKVGTAGITITATGKNYKGTITASFRILPKKAVISGVAVGRKKMTVRLKTKVKKTGGNTYQIAYRVKGTSKWKKVNTKKKSRVIRSLKNKKKYQVRVRAFTKIGKRTYYGPWSKIYTTGKIKR